jgi:hypothetical protein
VPEPAPALPIVKPIAREEGALDAPWGSFTLHNTARRPAVFLTGGIGVTPVRSIALQSVRGVLEGAGVDSDDIRTGEFTGY